jgi:predicted aldo/keto reductase-like oxidoreductase
MGVLCYYCSITINFVGFRMLSRQKYVATTADAWSAAGYSFLGVTCHWIDEVTRNRRSCVLACRVMTESHTHDYIARLLSDIHREFRIEETCVRTTTDNAANFG